LERGSPPNAYIEPVYLVALAVGFHGVAEGVAIGIGIAPASSALEAVGGTLAVASFILHKVLEGFVISVFLGSQRVYVRTSIAALVAGVPTMLGSAIGSTLSPDSSFFFALGGGAALWLLAMLIQQSSAVSNRTVWAISLLAGILLMYSTGLLHSG